MSFAIVLSCSHILLQVGHSSDGSNEYKITAGKHKESGEVSWRTGLREKPAVTRNDSSKSPSAC